MALAPSSKSYLYNQFKSKSARDIRLSKDFPKRKKRFETVNEKFMNRYFLDLPWTFLCACIVVGR